MLRKSVLTYYSDYSVFLCQDVTVSLFISNNSTFIHVLEDLVPDQSVFGWPGVEIGCTEILLKSGMIFLDCTKSVSVSFFYPIKVAKYLSTPAH